MSFSKNILYYQVVGKMLGRKNLQELQTKGYRYLFEANNPYNVRNHTFISNMIRQKSNK